MSNQFPTRTRPDYGRLVFVRDNDQEVTIKQGAWGVLQTERNKLKNDPQFRGGKLKLKYI